MRNNIHLVGVGKINMEVKEKGFEFGSLQEYISIATSVVKAQCPGIRDGLVGEILSNEDAISDIAYSIMLADCKFDGRGTRYGFRSQHAKWAIWRYLEKRTKSREIMSLDFNFGDEDDSNSLGDTIDSGTKTPEEIAEKKESLRLVDEIINDGITLNHKERVCVKSYYLDNMTLDSIRPLVNVKTRQGVHVILKRAMAKIRERVGNES